MNAELKAKWIAALRSGEYRQGDGQLKDVVNRFCCLGVLCDISGLGEWNDNHLPCYVVSQPSLESSSAFMLPDGVSKALEVLPAHESKLSKMNDGGKSFAEIADYIEANL